ncbi:MAG: transporter substrate-binding domain-containing protein [Kiritimatiellia bacterium]|nr:transporter substrate-binding domain-containing protein [Kiritimatiellia bacterium]MDP6811199.1 transporter substrate-binding domain-containing protein [Kiritimatiellia bacterium]MDP7024356.1 transporter substrate-binding domain-containing protein [Kiritimatiellia bacterium]
MSISSRFVLNSISRRGVAALVGVLLGAAGWCLPVTAQEAVRPFRFTMEDYPPFEYEEDGKPTGIDVEVVTRIMDRLGIPFTIDFYPFPRAWMLLTKGKAEAATSISYNPSREPHLLFTAGQKAFWTTGEIPDDYLWMTEYVFFVRRRLKDSLEFRSYEQLEHDNYRIGINKEYTYHPAFWEHKLNTHEYIGPSEAFGALAEGQIELFPMDRTIGLWTLKRMGLESEITHLGRPLFRKPYLMVFSRASDYPDIAGVMKRFYAELAAMRESGEYDQIRSRYVSGASLHRADRPLRFVCEEWVPFEYLADGKPRGIDVEVTDRIMKRLGVPYEIQFYPWSRAWLMAEKGQAEAVLSVSYKASREKVLYYTPEQAAFAKTGELPPDYLWQADYVFFVKKKYADTYCFDSYEQVRTNGYRIGTNKDYSYDDAFRQADLSRIEYPDTKAGLTALVAEEIDMYPMVKTVGLATLKEMGLSQSVTWLPKPLFSKPYLVPFCRTSDYHCLEYIMYAYYRELASLRRSGEYEEIYKRHVLPEQ